MPLTTNSSNTESNPKPGYPLNGEVVDALSFIVHADKPAGGAIAEKLKS